MMTHAVLEVIVGWILPFALVGAGVTFLRILVRTVRDKAQIPALVEWGVMLFMMLATSDLMLRTTDRLEPVFAGNGLLAAMSLSLAGLLLFMLGLAQWFYPSAWTRFMEDTRTIGGPLAPTK